MSCWLDPQLALRTLHRAQPTRRPAMGHRYDCHQHLRHTHVKESRQRPGNQQWGGRGGHGGWV